MKRLLDPRVKLFLLLFAAVYISVPLNPALELGVVLIYVLPLFLAGLYFLGSSFLMVYALQIFASFYILPLISSAFFIFVFSFLVYGLRLLLPSIIAGAYAMKTTPVNEWIAAYKKLHAPNWLLIPLAVVARFFPTIREDFYRIRQAMAFRGIGTSFWDLVKRPLQTLEYILIPLLMNAAQVAEDLTISSLTKGLSLPGKHTTIIQLKMTVYDWLYILMAILPYVFYKGGIFSWIQ